MTSAGAPGQWPVKPYAARHASWPYSEADFARQDARADSNFYSVARFVTHIDEAAIAALREYYDAELPTEGRILDFCSSWVSHYPARIEAAVRRGAVLVCGVGMNEAELRRNPLLTGTGSRVYLVHDLNEQPDLAKGLEDAYGGDEDDRVPQFDAATNVVSIDYLTHPVEVLRSLRGVMKEGGKVHLVISNRCFPTKAIARWLRVSEEERLQMVGDFLHFAGWKEIEIVELSDGKAAEADTSGSVQGLMSWMSGGNVRDPLWVVRAINER